MKYDGINWAGWVVIILFYVIWCSVFFILFGWGGIFFSGVLTCVYVYGIIKYISNKINRSNSPSHKDKKREHFTNEDFLYCKVGEWVSKR